MPDPRFAESDQHGAANALDVRASLAHVVFVLVNPSHPGNVGAAARAIGTMGWRGLRVVQPRFDIPAAGMQAHPEARAFASGALAVLEQICVFDDLKHALADCHLALGLSARTRAFAPPMLNVSQAAEFAVSETQRTKARVAFVFGTERIGLTSIQLQACHRFVQIDADPECSSLNLAQAVQIVAYEMRRAAGFQGTSLLDVEKPRYASHDEVEALYAHLHEACIAVGFIDPEHPKKLFERMRRLFARTRLEQEEVQLLRGLCKQMLIAASNQLPVKRP